LKINRKIIKIKSEFFYPIVLIQQILFKSGCVDAHFETSQKKQQKKQKTAKISKKRKFSLKKIEISIKRPIIINLETTLEIQTWETHTQNLHP
jgi:hypothetical protein